MPTVNANRRAERRDRAYAIFSAAGLLLIVVIAFLCWLMRLP